MIFNFFTILNFSIYNEMILWYTYAISGEIWR